MGAADDCRRFFILDFKRAANIAALLEMPKDLLSCLRLRSFFGIIDGWCAPGAGESLACRMTISKCDLGSKLPKVVLYAGPSGLITYCPGPGIFEALSMAHSTSDLGLYLDHAPPVLVKLVICLSSRYLDGCEYLLYYLLLRRSGHRDMPALCADELPGKSVLEIYAA